MIILLKKQTMRKSFFDNLYQYMIRDKNIILITGDLGYGLIDAIRNDFPAQFINTGAAEQAMMGIAVGMAMEGKIPVVYSITPFLLFRPFETIRNYINHEKIPVKLIGSGRGKDYSHDGFSHWAEDDEDILIAFENIECWWPQSKERIPALVDEMLYNNKPCYLNLKR